MGRLEQLRAARDAATPGPWQVSRNDPKRVMGAGDQSRFGASQVGLTNSSGFNKRAAEDVALIVAAENALPALLEVAETARAFLLAVNRMVGGGRAVEAAYEAFVDAVAALDGEG